MAKKNNLLIKTVEKRLSNPKNVAPAAIFIQNQKKKKKKIQELLNQM